MIGSNHVASLSYCSIGEIQDLMSSDKLVWKEFSYHLAVMYKAALQGPGCGALAIGCETMSHNQSVKALASPTDGAGHM